MIGDYNKTTYVNGQAPAVNAVNLNNNENKTKELDVELAAHIEYLIFMDIRGIRRLV